MLDRADNQRLLQIENLQLSGLHYDGLSQQLRIADILLSKPYARIEINEEGSPTCSNCCCRNPPRTPGRAPPPHIVIDQIRTAQGNLRFADRSLSPEFVVDIASLDGQSRHISNTRGSAPSSPSTARWTATPPSPSGGANLLIEDPVLDVAVAFNNLELTTFTPYSSTYAGYAIDKGQLSMKLNYKLQGNRLEGTTTSPSRSCNSGRRSRASRPRICPRPRHRPAERFERRHQDEPQGEGQSGSA